MTYQPQVEVKESTQSLLKDWKPPRHAYVLFEKREFAFQKDQSFIPTTGLMTLNVEHRPEQVSKLMYYTGPMKKFRIIGYGNFPKNGAGPLARQKLAKLYSDKDGVNPWDILEENVKHFMTFEPDWKEQRAKLSAENAELKSEREILLARLKAVERDLEGKKNGNETSRSGKP